MSESSYDLGGLCHCLTLAFGLALIPLPWGASFLGQATNALLRSPLHHFSLALKFQKELAGEIILHSEGGEPRLQNDPRDPKTVPF